MDQVEKKCYSIWLTPKSAAADLCKKTISDLSEPLGMSKWNVLSPDTRIPSAVGRPWLFFVCRLPEDQACETFPRSDGPTCHAHVPILQYIDMDQQEPVGRLSLSEKRNKQPNLD